MVLGLECRDTCLRPTLLRQDEKISFDDPGGELFCDDDLPERRQGRRFHGCRQDHAGAQENEINDMFTKGGTIRADGVMIHNMYVMQVKSPQESKYPWDYYKVVKVMSGEEAFGPITGLCPLAPK